MEQQLKERVVGAVVLVCAAVIVIPMVLSGNVEEAPRTEPAGAPAPPSPPVPERGFSSRVVPLAPLDAPAPREAPAREMPPPRAERAPQPSPPRAATATPPPARPAARPAPPAPGAPGAAAGGDWVVQLGSFSNARNARALRDRLRTGGYPAFMRSSTRDGAEVTRVYVGPQSSRERAEAMVARLQKETRLKGIVLQNAAR